MKRGTLILGVTATFLFLLGLLFKILHWPGAGIMLTLSTPVFALLYSPLLLIDRNRATQDGYQKFVNLMSAVVMSVISISFTFKVMHWPGAEVGIYAGHILMLVMIPVLFVHGAKAVDEIKKMNFFNEAILWCYVTGFSFFIWLIIGR